MGNEGLPDDVAAHYDDLDPLYRRIWGEHLHHGLWRTGDESPEQAAEAMTELVGERLGLHSGQWLCDVGCGYGRMARELAGRFDVRVTGLTISEKQAARAMRDVDDRVHITHGDWMDNGLPDQRFDAVLAVESLEHMHDPARAVAEMARVLRPGGRVVLCCWLRIPDPLPWERRFLLDPIAEDGRLAGMSTERQVTGWLEAAGLVLEQSEDLSREVERTWPVCIGRSTKALFTDSGTRRFLLARFGRSRAIGVTLFRIWAAYVLGAMRYVIFTARKPG
ncbi:methyltransferase [Haloferula helveola]|uniref:Methyltransferase n=1 Tax=Haloferula helveola TaxID=490095 RepID=A0ABM7RJ17_9BACT|nr:methyltransferase [Haloferula helveola]